MMINSLTLNPTPYTQAVLSTISMGGPCCFLKGVHIFVHRHDVIGVFMRNWDEAEERVDSACSADADWTDAQRVASHLDIPIHHADFVRQYWTQVFSEFVTQVT